MKIHFGVNDRFLQNFIDMTVDLNCAQENVFIIYGVSAIGFTKNYDKNYVIFVKDLFASNRKIEPILSRSSTIYIHYLSDEVVEFLSRYSIGGKTIVWLFWGNDGFPLVEQKIKELPTLNLLDIIRRARLMHYRKKNVKTLFKINFLRRIDYFAHYIIEDFLLFKPLLATNCKFIFFSYGVLEQVVRDNFLNSNSILVGNSADSTNNHIYILKNLLPKSVNGDLVFPLSYSGKQSYVNSICYTGKKRYPRNFKALLDVIDLEGYIKILSNCSFAIMFHTRAQAWGNIMQLLWQGSKVFFYSENNLFLFLRSKGFCVYGIKRKMSISDFQLLSKDEQLTNKKMLIDFFGKKALLSHYNKLLSIDQNQINKE
jgi:dTDP-N-acetylfucosamine:lipid II N-acetylfucosaminyltransferase